MPCLTCHVRKARRRMLLITDLRDDTVIVQRVIKLLFQPSLELRKLGLFVQIAIRRTFPTVVSLMTFPQRQQPSTFRRGTQKYWKIHKFIQFPAGVSSEIIL